MLPLHSIRRPVIPFTLLMLLAACSQVSPTPKAPASLSSQGASYTAQDLGALRDTESYAQGVSADGTTIVGQGETYAPRSPVHTSAFFWTETGGVQKLGSLPDPFETRAYGVSADGTKIVGQSPFINNYHHAAIWTKGGDAQDLGTLSTEGSYSTAFGISADGTTVVGDSDSPEPNVPTHAFRWTKAGGMQDLGTLGGGDSTAYAANANGSAVVGVSQIDTNSTTTQRAFRWTKAGGMQDLGTLGGVHSLARGISADGKTVVGYSMAEGASFFERHAFSWTEAGGMKDLGSLSGAGFSEAYGVSADGKTVVGYSSADGRSPRAFRWTAAEGMQGLPALPESGGDYAYGISADGGTIIGRSQYPVHAVRWTMVNPTPKPQTATYTVDFERASTGRPLYSLRVGRGVTGSPAPGRISVSGKRLINEKFRNGQAAKVVSLYGSKRLVVSSGNTPNAGGGQLQLVFNAGAGFGGGSVTVKSLTLSNVTVEGAYVNLYRGRTLIRKVAVPVTGAGKHVVLSFDEADVTIVSTFARFPLAVDDLVFENERP